MARTTQEVLRLQVRVIYALALREAAARFGRTKLGYFWALMEPLAYILISTGLYTFLGRQPPVGDSILMFFVVGFIPFMIFRGLASKLTRVIDTSDGLLTFPVIKPPDVIAAKIVLEVATLAVVTVIVFAGVAFFSQVAFPHDPVAVIAAVGTIILLGAGIGIVNSVVAIFFTSWERVFPVMFRLVIVFSGVYTITDRLPEQLRAIIIWSPINHCIEWVRVGFFKGYDCYSLDRGYPALIGLFLVVAGLSAERALRRRIASI